MKLKSSKGYEGANLFTDNKSLMRCSMLNLQSEGHGLKNMGPRLSLSRHTQDRYRSISQLKYDPSVNQTAKSYFTTIVNKKQKQSETKLDGNPKKMV